MDPATGQFIWPKATPEVHKGQKFPGEMTTWDKQSYAKNVKVLAFYPGVGSPFHAWNNIADFEGRRYLYVHDRDYLRILDVTDPPRARSCIRRAASGAEGFERKVRSGQRAGLSGRRHHRLEQKLGKPVLVASFEIGRYGLLNESWSSPTRSPRNASTTRSRDSRSLPWTAPAQPMAPARDPHDGLPTPGRPHRPAARIRLTGFARVLRRQIHDPVRRAGRQLWPDRIPELPVFPGYQVWDMTDPRTPSSSRRSPCRVRSWATRNTKRPI